MMNLEQSYTRVQYLPLPLLSLPPPPPLDYQCTVVTCSAASSPPLRLVCPLSLILSIAFFANTLPDDVIGVTGSSLST